MFLNTFYWFIYDHQIESKSLQVLLADNYHWDFCSEGSVPSGAVVAGHTSDGEPLYVGRVLHNGSQTVGKVSKNNDSSLCDKKLQIVNYVPDYLAKD